MTSLTDTTSGKTGGRDALLLVARLLLAALFVLAGLSKLGTAGPTTAYIASVGLPMPEIIYYATIAIEAVGGLLLIAGFKTRYTAVALGLFSIAAGVIFHTDFADQIQITMFLKNLAIAGGMFALAASGPGRLSVDRG